MESIIANIKAHIGEPDEDSMRHYYRDIVGRMDMLCTKVDAMQNVQGGKEAHFVAQLVASEDPPRSPTLAEYGSMVIQNRGAHVDANGKQTKKKKTRLWHVADARNKGKTAVVEMLTSPSDMTQFWDEYNNGLNSVKALRVLEAQDKLWRQYPGGKEAWAWRKYVGDATDKCIAKAIEEGNDKDAATAIALRDMQLRLNKLNEKVENEKKNRLEKGHTRKGRRFGVQWSELTKELREENPRGLKYGGVCGQCKKRKQTKQVEWGCMCEGGPVKGASEVRSDKRQAVWAAPAAHSILVGAT